MQNVMECRSELLANYRVPLTRSQTVHANNLLQQFCHRDLFGGYAMLLPPDDN